MPWHQKSNECLLVGGALRRERGGESLARVTMVRLGFETPYLQVELPDPIDPRKRFSPSLQKATPMRSEERIGVAKAQVKPSGCRCRRQATPA